MLTWAVLAGYIIIKVSDESRFLIRAQNKVIYKHRPYYNCVQLRSARYVVKMIEMVEVWCANL